MRKELEKKLFNKYPTIFSNKDKSPQESCMYFGIEAGDGWYDIIDNACEKLQKLVEENPGLEIYATQVKEKFGTLRFYIAGGTDEAYDIISEAESKSEITCEECGNETSNGQKDYNGWIRTLCSRCEFLTRL